MKFLFAEADNIFLLWFSFSVVYGNYFCFLKQMETFVRENPDVPVFQLSYEDMRKVGFLCFIDLLLIISMNCFI